VDARRIKSEITFVYIIDVTLRANPRRSNASQCNRKLYAARTPVTTRSQSAERVGRSGPLVNWFGPCGLFAGVDSGQMGLQPIVLGSAGRECCLARTKDTWALKSGAKRCFIAGMPMWQCFGEGRTPETLPPTAKPVSASIKDPKFLRRKVMHEFVARGATEEIIVRQQAAYRHFPPDRVFQAMREEIQGTGWRSQDSNSRVADFLINDGRILRASPWNKRESAHAMGACPGPQQRATTFRTCTSVRLN